MQHLLILLKNIGELCLLSHSIHHDGYCVLLTV